MKRINVTFSIPAETHELLQSLVGRRKMSSFVSGVLKRALEEKRETLKKAYREAESDTDRIETIEDWGVLDVEGWK